MGWAFLLELTGDFRRTTMAMIFRLRDVDHYPQEEWDIGSVLAKRRALMIEEPIISSKITRLDLWLLDQPDLTLQEAGEIWTRTMIVSLMLYQLEKDRGQRRSILLSLREHFEEFKNLPEKWQENMRLFWLPWLNVLNGEESEWEEARRA
jgi:hypothetical protein